MKKYIIYLLILLFNLSLVSAITQQEIKEAKSLIDSKADCKSLSEHQLEIMGEYYMEQMHPGESHELMHQMMGLKEGSEDEELFHINMAKAIYCGETNAFGSGGMMGYGMMGSGSGKATNYGGMMNMIAGNLGYGMMGTSYGYLSFLNFLSIVLVIGLVILVYLWIMKLWKEVFKKK